jgi:hypothetical protein
VEFITIDAYFLGATKEEKLAFAFKDVLHSLERVCKTGHSGRTPEELMGVPNWENFLR